MSDKQGWKERLRGDVRLTLPEKPDIVGRYTSCERFLPEDQKPVRAWIAAGAACAAVLIALAAFTTPMWRASAEGARNRTGGGRVLHRYGRFPDPGGLRRLLGGKRCGALVGRRVRPAGHLRRLRGGYVRRPRGRRGSLHPAGWLYVPQPRDIQPLTLGGVYRVERPGVHPGRRGGGRQRAGGGRLADASQRAPGAGPATLPTTTTAATQTPFFYATILESLNGSYMVRPETDFKYAGERVHVSAPKGAPSSKRAIVSPSTTTGGLWRAIRLRSMPCASKPARFRPPIRAHK